MTIFANTNRGFCTKLLITGDCLVANKIPQNILHKIDLTLNRSFIEQQMPLRLLICLQISNGLKGIEILLGLFLSRFANKQMRNNKAMGLG